MKNKKAGLNIVSDKEIGALRKALISTAEALKEAQEVLDVLQGDFVLAAQAQEKKPRKPYKKREPKQQADVAVLAHAIKVKKPNGAAKTTAMSALENS